MTPRLDLPTLDARARGLGARLLRARELEALAGAPSVARARRRSWSGPADSNRRATRRPRPPSRRRSGSTAAAHLRVARALGAAGRGARRLLRRAGPAQSARAAARRRSGRAGRGAARGPRSHAALPERALDRAGAPADRGRASRPSSCCCATPRRDRARRARRARRSRRCSTSSARCSTRSPSGASRSARRGDRNLRDVVACAVDVGNVRTGARARRGPARRRRRRRCFVDGGAVADRATRSSTRAREPRGVASTSSSSACWRGRALARVAATRVAETLRGSSAPRSPPWRTEQRRRARLDPLGSAPLALLPAAPRGAERRRPQARLGRGARCARRPRATRSW